MKFSRLFIFSILALVSCSSDQNTLVLKVRNTYGLTNNSPVTLNGTEIGKYKLRLNQSYAEIILKSKSKLLKIPIDSKLEISELAELKNIKTEILHGKSNIFFKSGDTLSWFVSNDVKDLEKTLLVGDFLFTSKNKDSIDKTKEK